MYPGKKKTAADIPWIWDAKLENAPYLKPFVSACIRAPAEKRDVLHIQYDRLLYNADSTQLRALPRQESLGRCAILTGGKPFPPELISVLLLP